MNCSKCGEILKAGAAYCINCGTKADANNNRVVIDMDDLAPSRGQNTMPVYSGTANRPWDVSGGVNQPGFGGNPFMQNPANNNMMNQRFAGFWVRAIASIIDSLVLGVVGAVLGVIFARAEGLLVILGIIVNLSYFACLESSDKQATFGKRAMGIIVVDAQGNRMSTGQAWGRTLSKILSSVIMSIGYLMVAFTEKKQGLHDKMADTYVVYK